MSSDAGADDQETARCPEARSDERRIPIAHQARPRKGRTSDQKVLANVDVGPRCANRKDDPLKLVVGPAGNRAAAVVAGFNVIVFTVIAVLAHRDKLQKKRNHQQPLPATGNLDESASEEFEAEVDRPVEAKKIALEVQAVEIRNA